MLSTSLTHFLVTSDLDAARLARSLQSRLRAQCCATTCPPPRTYWNGFADPHAGTGPDQIPQTGGAFGSPEGVFQASLTELEGAGIQAGFGAVDRHRQVGRTRPGGNGAGRSRLESPSSRSMIPLSAASERNLRSAAHPLRARRSRCADQAGSRDGGDAASHALRVGNGGAAGLRPGGAGTGDY